VVDPPERLRDAAQALAEKVARNDAATLAATKRALWGALETGLSDARRAGYPLALETTAAATDGATG
jgi:enoyl-CoA hydratase